VQPASDQGASAPGATSSSAVLYEDPAAAARAVQADYLYWSGRLTDTSFQLSIALIGANWAVFSTTRDVLANPWARASIAAVVLSLGISLFGAKVMSELHRERLLYAENDPLRWRGEFDESHGRAVPWPFTSDIESLGYLLRWCKTWLPLGGGILFLAGVILS
jgi:hypothetical protein